MTIRKLIDGFEYHSVINYSIDKDGFCTAHVGSFDNAHSAYTLQNPQNVRSFRCDGVVQNEFSSISVYSMLASYPDFYDADPLSPDAIAGFSNPTEPRPAQPSILHVWDGSSWMLPDSAVVGAKQLAKERITAARNIEEKDGFMAYGKVFDSDATSLQRISIAVQAAQVIGEQFTIEWTCKDNSTITLDYAQTIALPLIMAQAANALHVKARALKAQIDAATTLEEINAVVW